MKISQETALVENNPENIKIITARYHQTIFPFYASYGVRYDFQAKKAKISCRLFVNPNAKAKVLVVTGYNESYIKYAEIIYDLYHRGYSVYAYDHRGQGFSEKFPNQKHRGFLNSFDDLVEDLKLYFDFVNEHDSKKDVFVLAHSMGAAVATIAICQNKFQPKRIVLSAPMFGICLTSVPILEYPIYLISAGLSAFGFGKLYAFGQKDCFPLKPFENNRLTHSKARYQIWQSIIRETPDVQLGGPTFQWIRECIHASRFARTLGNENTTPLLLLQAENDTVVRNDCQDTFLKHCARSQKKVIMHAKHEILMELESLRDQTLKCIFDFFEEVL